MTLLRARKIRPSGGKRPVHRGGRTASPVIAVSATTARAGRTSILSDVLAPPSALPASSFYTMLNGLLYMALGATLILRPTVVQELLREPAFAGHEEGLFRVIGLTVTVIGWLYLFGGSTGAKRVVASSVFDRLTLVPLVLIPVALAGVFPHVCWTLAIADPVLGFAACILLGWENAGFGSAAETSRIDDHVGAAKGELA